MPPTPDPWQAAFAKQSYSDYLVYNRLCQHSDLPECQRLHYLQMSLEKIAKAHLYYVAGGTGGLPANIQTSHNFIAKVLPQVYRAYFIEHGIRKEHQPEQAESHTATL